MSATTARRMRSRQRTIRWGVGRGGGHRPTCIGAACRRQVQLPGGRGMSKQSSSSRSSSYATGFIPPQVLLGRCMPPSPASTYLLLFDCMFCLTSRARKCCCHMWASATATLASSCQCCCPNCARACSPPLLWRPSTTRASAPTSTGWQMT
jgi:hypothetical protein